MDKRDNVEYMYNYLKHAFKFETYKYLWSEALQASNQELARMNQEYADCDASITTSNETLMLLDSTTKSEVEEIRKQVKLYKIGKILAVLFFAIFPFNFLVFYYLHKKQKEEQERLDYISSQQLKDIRVMCEHENIKNNKLNMEQLKIDAQNLKQNQQAIVKNLNYAQSVLDKIYSENVIHSKYRSLGIVGTLCGYLETGRCIIIRGHGGIYDTYEEDLKAKLILIELQEIKARLANIEHYQKLIYQEMTAANRSLNEIKSTLNRIDSNVLDIKCNTAISAAADTQTAAAANYMAWTTYGNAMR